MKCSLSNALVASWAFLLNSGTPVDSFKLKNNKSFLSSFSVQLKGKAKLFESPSAGSQEPDEKNQDIPAYLQADTAEDVTDDCVKHHNLKRVGNLTHPLPPMSKDPVAVAQAMKYMREHFADGCPSMKHSGASGFGENLYAVSGGVAICENATEAWYKEINLFNGVYPGGNWIMPAGHFTQVMWETSTGLGCAKVIGCPTWNMLVCNYTPPGNWWGSAPFSLEVWNSIMEASGNPVSTPPSSGGSGGTGGGGGGGDAGSGGGGESGAGECCPCGGSSSPPGNGPTDTPEESPTPPSEPSAPPGCDSGPPVPTFSCCHLLASRRS